jgi:hypothetical protein
VLISRTNSDGLSIVNAGRLRHVCVVTSKSTLIALACAVKVFVMAWRNLAGLTSGFLGRMTVDGIVVPHNRIANVAHHFMAQELSSLRREVAMRRALDCLSTLPIDVG